MTAKNLVKWNPVRDKNRFGIDIFLKSLETIDLRYKGTLLSRILAMPAQTPIALEDAVRIVRAKQTEAFNVGQVGEGPGHHGWFAQHFIEWISEQGFHIELTGDEWQPYSASSKAA